MTGPPLKPNEGTGGCRTGAQERNETVVNQNVTPSDPYNGHYSLQDRHGPFNDPGLTSLTSPQSVHVRLETQQPTRSQQVNPHNHFHHQQQLPQHTGPPYHHQFVPQQPVGYPAPPFIPLAHHVPVNNASQFANVNQYGSTSVGFPIPPPPFAQPFAPHPQPVQPWAGTIQNYIPQVQPGIPARINFIMSNPLPPWQGVAPIPVNHGHALYPPPPSDGSRQAVEGPEPSRPGPRGKLKCDRCRRQKQGQRAPCVLDPDDPHGGCIPCKKSGRGSDCGERKYPPPKNRPLGDKETEKRNEAWIEQLSPKLKNAVLAAKAKVQQSNANTTVSNTDTENNGTVSVGVSSHISDFPGTGITPAPPQVHFMGSGASTRREPSRHMYPVATRSATWAEAHRSNLAAARSNNPPESGTAESSKRSRELSYNIAQNTSRDDDKSDDEENPKAIGDPTMEQISSILAVHLPSNKRRKIVQIVERELTQPASPQSRSTSSPPVKSPSNSIVGDTEEFISTLDDNAPDLESDDDGEILHPYGDESPTVSRTPAAQPNWSSEYLVTSPPSDYNVE